MNPSTVLALLLSANILKYLDRQVLYPLLPLIKSDMGLSDAQLGALASVFMLAYMCSAPVLGFLADQGKRVRWMASAVGWWSISLAATGLCRNYASLLITRSMFGFGEAGFTSVSPAFLAERYPKERRGWILAVFSMAIPVGSALGYLFGGWAGQNFGWRWALAGAALPGLFIAPLLLRLKDPRKLSRSGRDLRPKFKDYLSLYRTRSYTATTLAMAALTFALGGLAVWMPSYFTRYWGMSVAEAGLTVGAVTVTSGLVGSLAGGWIGDRLLKVTGRAYFLVSGAGLILAMPAGIAALLCPSKTGTIALLFAAETFAFLNMGPLNAVIVRVISSPMRSMAFAANIFVIHGLGDLLSPAMIGALSDRWSLRGGLVLAMAALGLAGLICLWGTRYIEEDCERIQEA